MFAAEDRDIKIFKAFRHSSGALVIDLKQFGKPHPNIDKLTWSSYSGAAGLYFGPGDGRFYKIYQADIEGSLGRHPDVIGFFESTILAPTPSDLNRTVRSKSLIVENGLTKILFYMMKGHLRCRVEVNLPALR